MQSFAGFGVPQMLVTVGTHREVVQGGHLHGGRTAVSTLRWSIRSKRPSTAGSVLWWPLKADRAPVLPTAVKAVNG